VKHHVGNISSCHKCGNARIIMSTYHVTEEVTSGVEVCRSIRRMAFAEASSTVLRHSAIDVLAV
jgi:hypothetical protein